MLDKAKLAAWVLGGQRSQHYGFQAFLWDSSNEQLVMYLSSI